MCRYSRSLPLMGPLAVPTMCTFAGDNFGGPSNNGVLVFGDGTQCQQWYRDHTTIRCFVPAGVAVGNLTVVVTVGGQSNVGSLSPLLQASELWACAGHERPPPLSLPIIVSFLRLSFRGNTVQMTRTVVWACVCGCLAIWLCACAGVLHQQAVTSVWPPVRQ